MNRTNLLIILNLLIGLIWGLEQFEFTNFLTVRVTDSLELWFFGTLALWNLSLIIDRRKKK
tara:strand:- start:415 stop:597 length:183 start_codon:yes stop_codon:yes gene_type:complete